MGLDERQYKMSEIETWKPVIGFEEHYNVSNMGRVFSKYTGRMLKGGTSGRSGKYKSVQLRKDASKHSIKIHKIVMDSFAGECPMGMEIDHINGIHDDSRLSNLEYVTRRENQMRHWYKIAQNNDDSGARWEKNKKRWRCEISYKNKTTHIMYSKSKKLCHMTYLSAIRSIRDGEFSSFMDRIREYNMSKAKEVDEWSLQYLK